MMEADNGVRRPRSILVPLLNVSVATDVLALAACLIAGSETFLPHAARILVLAVVTVPEGQPPAEGRNIARAYRAMLGYLPPAVTPPGPPRPPARDAPPPPVPVHTLIKVAPSLAAGIQEAVTSEAADLLMLYWKGYASQPEQHSFGATLDLLLANPPCNLLLVRPGQWPAARRILLPLRGGPGAELALDTGLNLAGHLGIPATVLHSMPAGIERRRGNAPYLALQDRLAQERGGPAAPPVEQVFARTPDIRRMIQEQLAAHDLVILGLRDPDPQTGSMRSPLLDQLLADGTRPVLLARAPRPLDLETYHARLLTQPAATWTAEQWFVENTYQRDEFANLAKWLQARADRQAHISVVLPTRNDAGRIVSLLTGMRRALQVDPPEPIADEILVVDAGSQDDTASLAAGQGVPVLRLAPPAGARSLLVGPAAVLGGALNLAMGDILVWLDPQAGRVHPSYVALLAGPLLHDPQVLLVKPFWATDARGAAEIEAPGGLADARFSAISVDDLLAWPIPRLATLPLHSWLRAFYPRLGAVMQPLGRLFAARISLLRELLPALDAYEAAARAERDRTPAFSPNTAFFAGMLLETATRHSTRAIAQVEMQTRPRGHSRQSVVNPDVRQLRQVAELLAFFAARPDSVPRQAAIEQLRHRILTSSS